jgi:hypothetical protein
MNLAVIASSASARDRVRIPGKVKQLSEPTIVVIALRTVAVTLDPFRMLLEERVVHGALKLGVSGNFTETIGR